MPPDSKEKVTPGEVPKAKAVSVSKTGLSEAGIRGMRGLTDGQLRPAASRAELDSMRSEITGRYAEHRAGNSLRGKITGDIGENLYTLGLSKTDNLNRHAVNINEYRNNFPLCDVTTPREMASVKAYVWNENESARNAAYAKELTRLTGKSKPAERGRYEGMKVSEVCASRFSQIRTEEPEHWESLGQVLPLKVTKAVEQGDQGEIADAIEKNSVLAIPDDHVDSLKGYIQRHPEKAGIDPAAAKQQQSEMKKLFGRIRGMGVSSNHIRDEALGIYQSMPQASPP